MLYLVCENVSIIGYTDSDYVGYSNIRKPTSRYIVQFMAGASHILEMSSPRVYCLAKVEYVVTSEACKEVYGFPN